MLFQQLMLLYPLFCLAMFLMTTTGTVQAAQSENSSNKEKSSAVESKEKSKSDPENNNLIELNFQNASLASILDYLAQEKNLNLIPPGKELADKKVSLYTRKPIDLEQAWQVLNTLLEINGFRIVKFGALHRVMSIKDSTNESMAVYVSTHPDGINQLPDSGEIVTFVYYLNNMKGDQAATVINALTGEKPILFSDLDMCIIRGASYRIKAALEIIEHFDKEQLKQNIQIIKLKYTTPDVVSKLVQDEIINSKGQDAGRVRFISNNRKDITFLPGSVRIIPDVQHGSLILLGQEKQIAKIKDFIEKVLDVPWGGEKTRIRIRDIKYRPADQLQRTLERIIKSTNQASQGKQQAFKDMKIVAETGSNSDSNSNAGNRLIISCDPLDWPKIDALIDNLDSLKPQIAFEVMIVDVTLQLNRALQGHIRDTGYGILGDNNGWAINNLAPNMSTTDQWRSMAGTLNLMDSNASGETLLTFGNSAQNATGLWGILRAAFQETNSNIIAQPFLVVNNGEDCSFTDQQSRRVEGELVNRGNANVQKQEQVSATNKIGIKARINADSIVDLTIEVRAEDFTKSDIKGADSTIRSVNTKVCMKTGEVLILGGLSLNDKKVQKYNTPFLSEIPILGNFLKSKSKNTVDKTLFIFIRPSIIKPRERVEPDDYTQFKLDYAKLNIKRSDDYAKEKDPINKLFFKPPELSVAEATANSLSEIYRPIDDFAQRKKLPLCTDIRRDNYYRASNKFSVLQNFKHKKNEGLRQKQLLSLKRRHSLNQMDNQEDAA